VLARGALGVVCAVLGAAHATDAWGQTGAVDPVEPCALEYHVPAGCPDEVAFVAQVRARTARFVVAEGVAPVHEFAVNVVTSAHGVEGRLTTHDASGHRATRAVTGDACGEVIGALALVTAIAVDPNASTAPTPAPPSGAPAPSPAPTPPPVLAALPPSPPAGSSMAAPGEAPSPVTHGHARWTFSAGAGVSVTGAVAPDPIPSVAAFLETRFDLGGLWAPALRLGFERAPGSTFEASGGTSASLDWSVGTLHVCPLRWQLGPLALVPCARVAAGVLHGQGVQIAQPRDESRPWLDAGLIGDARWTPLRPLFLELYGGLIIPLLRDRFHFDTPDVTIHQVPDLGGVAGADVGLSFW
jgi:hypothetical protein